jgi:hypothetical protein
MTAAQVSGTPGGNVWLSLFANAVIWPGIGTLFLRRWFLGSVQAVVSLSGLFLLFSGVPSRQVVGVCALLGAFVWALATGLNAVCSESHGR